LLCPDCRCSASIRAAEVKEVKEGKRSFGEELMPPKLALAKSLDDDENKDEDK
jgi:hypothetical protein